jgi:uncharacterized transporter YbjL
VSALAVTIVTTLLLGLLCVDVFSHRTSRLERVLVCGMFAGALVAAGLLLEAAP